MKAHNQACGRNHILLSHIHSAGGNKSDAFAFANGFERLQTTRTSQRLQEKPQHQHILHICLFSCLLVIEHHLCHHGSLLLSP